jgi:L-rhamnose mutarotase
MFTLALIMRLKPGCLARYRAAHDELWPEIARSMSDNEISMTIYHEAGQLFVFAAAPSEAHWERSRNEPALERWNAAMTEFLEASKPGEIAFRHPEKVFGFGEFK